MCSFVFHDVNVHSTKEPKIYIDAKVKPCITNLLLMIWKRDEVGAIKLSQ